MKPIRMKIRGINSFLEEQEIDFQALSSQGLFGIFGPTGSGKSSILDGMTLALYGTTARNSTNFINVNAERGTVEYTFSVKEKKERIYQVFRSFKRSKEGAIRSHSARFAELTEGNAEILADKVSVVNEKCREVLGLSKEDFFRTVVLPQGKFSEFLKLEGMERNKMLERLFHLEKYGEQMAVLVKERASLWNGKWQEKEGAMSRYQEIEQEDLQRLLKREAEQKALASEKEEELRETRKRLEQGEKAAALEAEYEALCLEAGRQKEREAEIQNLQNEEQMAEKANALKAFSKEAKEAEADWTSACKKQELQRNMLEEKQKEEKEIKAVRQSLQTQVQEELPALQIEMERLAEAASLLTQLRREETGKKETRERLLQTAARLEESNLKMEKLLQDIEARKAQKEQIAVEAEANTVSAGKQQEIGEGYRLCGKVKEKTARRETLQTRLEELVQKRQESQKQYAVIKEQTEQKEKERQVLEKETKDLQKQQRALPDAEKETEYVLTVKAEQEKARHLQQEIEEQEKQCRIYKKEQAERKEELEICQKEKQIWEKRYLEHLASILALELREGQPCPVCGSIHHEKSGAHFEQEESSRITTEKEKTEKKLQKVYAEISRLEALVKKGEEKAGETMGSLQLLNKKWLEENLPKLEEGLLERRRLRTFLEEQLLLKEKSREKLEEALLDLQTKKTRAEAEQVHQTTREQEMQEEIRLLKKEEEQEIQKLSELKKKSQVQDFEIAYENLQEKNRIREEKQQQIKLLEAAITARVQNKEKGEGLIQGIKEEKARLEITLAKQTERIEELEKQVQAKAGSCKEPEKRCRELREKTEKIRKDYAEVQKRAESLTRELEAVSRDFAAGEALLEALEAEFCRKQKILQEKMQEYGIAEESWIVLYQREEDQLLQLRKQIETYRETCMKLQVRLEEIQKQRRVLPTLEIPLKVLKEKVRSLEEENAGGNRELGSLKQQICHLTKALKEKEKLETEQKEILHKLDILAELEGLFRGKRFVEYVSRYYLEYVSREANVQLKEMTGGSYGLETDGNGLFIIRDYKNGGVSRPASTLSGGETFMASLALALALSSQIQMKGAAPLEFFFLDEGFGTLDESCLEVVMEALEKIRNRKRSVGIITHVEEIKARIPMHLIVEPARLGEGGSKVRIEEA
nr:AAA family ATPase [uncultured Blautia sp.]